MYDTPQHGGAPADADGGHPGGRWTGEHPGGRRTGGYDIPADAILRMGMHSYTMGEGGYGGAPDVEAGKTYQHRAHPVRCIGVLIRGGKK